MIDKYQTFMDVFRKIADEYPSHFQDKNKLLALFIDLSPKSKIEIKTLRSFVLNNCYAAIEHTKGKDTSASTEELIKQIHILCGNPEIDEETASALCQSYADIIGVKYDRKRIRLEFALLNTHSRNGTVFTSNQGVSPLSSSSHNNQNSTINTGNRTTVTNQPPSPKPNNSIKIVVCILIIICLNCIYLLYKDGSIFFDSNGNSKSTYSTENELSDNIGNDSIDSSDMTSLNTASPIDSEDTLRGFLSVFSKNDISQWEYGDFDGNGIYEAFAEIVSSDSRHHLWYITIQGAVEVNTVDSGSISRVIRTNGRSFIIWKSDYQYTTSLCSCIGVKMGQWYRLELKGNDFVQDSSGDVYVAEPRFTYDGEYIRYTLCTFDEATLEWVETDNYYQEKKT